MKTILRGLVLVWAVWFMYAAFTHTPFFKPIADPRDYSSNIGRVTGFIIAAGVIFHHVRLLFAGSQAR